MDTISKYHFKQMLRKALWILGCMALFVLLLSAISRNKNLHCNQLHIAISGYNHQYFISNEEVQTILENALQSKIVGMPLEQIKMRKLEKVLQQNSWISKAQLYIDNKQTLNVAISERTPVARIFTESGQSFYLDSFAVALPLSDNKFADLPVFTNVANEDVTKGKSTESSHGIGWKQISTLSNAIKKDSFLIMQIGEVHCNLDSTFTMYPAVGNHVVLFGNMNHYNEKLRRLSIFYKQIIGKVGLNKYSVINLQYDKQVVATLNGKQATKANPQAAIKTFETLVNNAINEASDTTDILKNTQDKIDRMRPQVVESKSLLPVDSEQSQQEKVDEKKPLVAKQNTKPTPKKNVTPNKPKATMPKPNDY